MASTSTVPTPVIQENQLKIGQLMTDVSNPLRCTYRPPYKSNLVEITTITRKDSEFEYSTDNKASFFVELWKVFGVDVERKSSAVWNINAKKMRLHKMHNPDDLYQKLYRDPKRKDFEKAQTWIQARTYGRETIYMVVGVQTIKDVRVKRVAGSSSSFEIGNTIENALTINGKGAQTKVVKEAHTFKGEWVIEIEYTKLKPSGVDNQLVPRKVKRVELW